jgi:NADP-dependent 3-hydroxy acid dehydrogenase YdfG/tetratricopeptide (TPR) repeat protein
MSNTLYIAYCKDNQSVAQEIKEKLEKAQFAFNFLPCSDTKQDEGVNYLIANAEPQGLLLLSDNFLKSENCMQDLLSFIQNSPKAEQMQIVVTDGQYKDGNKETAFDRVSNVIQYMNYWQERYLELRKEKRSIKNGEEEAFNQRLQVVKDISSQIGDFLRIVRSKNYWTYDQMAFNDYELFFKKYGTTVQHQNYSRLTVNDPNKKSTVVSPKSETNQNKETQTINERLANIQPIVDEKVADLLLTNDESKEAVIEVIDPRQNQGNTDGDQQVIKAKHSSKNITLEEEEDEEQVIDEILDEMNTYDGHSILDSDKVESSDDLANIYEEDNSNEGENISDEEDHLDELIIEDVIIEEELAETSEEVDIDLLEVEEEFEEDFDPMEGVEIEDLMDDNVDSGEDDEEFEEENFSDIYNQEFFDDDDDDIEEEIDIIDLPDFRPSKRQVSLQTAISFMANGAHQEGIQVFEELLAENPENDEARFRFAKSLKEEMNDFDRASGQLERLIKSDPGHIGAYQLMAEIAEYNNDFLLAKSYYEKVLSVNPDAKGINYKLALITAGFFPDNPKLATKYFKKAIKENPTNDEAYFRLAQILNKLPNKSEKAIDTLETCLEINPDHAEANLMLADIFYQTKIFKQAAQYYENAWKILPELRTPERDAKFYAPDENKNNKVEEASTSKEEKSVAPLAPNLDKIVLITGATSGIGKATAHKFAAEGYRVILTGRRDDRLIKLKAIFEENFKREVKILPFDVRELDQVNEMIENLEEEWKNIDILINNAGLAKGFDPIQEGHVEHWDTMIDTNIKGLLYMTRAVTPHMVARRSGQIINVCSTAGKEVYPKGNVYCATKHAVDALTKAMRVDLHKHNIRVGQVSPGHVEETEFAYVRFEDEDRAKIYDDFKPLTSRDVAEAIFFIATAPPHVNIQDVLMTGTQQANSNFIDRSGR